MDLGTRWQLGSPPPDRLPATVRDAVARVETDLTGLAEELAAAGESFDPTPWRWTLTWLEGRPIVELDDGTRITYDPTTDTATVTEPE